jgi:phage terminase large subunit GpA-like protein
MLTSEELIVKKKGGKVFKEWKENGRNESFDLFVLNFAMAYSLGLDMWTETRWNRLLNRLNKKNELELKEENELTIENSPTKDHKCPQSKTIKKKSAKRKSRRIASHLL